LIHKIARLRFTDIYYIHVLNGSNLL